MIKSLMPLAEGYRALFCDVWGVVHNGVEAHEEACVALQQARSEGKGVVLVTNSPRPNEGVVEQLKHLGVPDDAWDRVVTSGDVTRVLIENGPRRLFHIGPERDLGLLDGLDVELVDDFEAAGVLCTGLFDDTHEKPQDYAEMLQRFRMRDLPFICANPDIMVERGDAHIWCAGALARDYGQLGGRTLIAGKPHRPIYDAALKAAEAILGSTVDPASVLAIGDGILTDVKGASDYGLDVLYVTAGVHAREYGPADDPDPKKLAAFLAKHGFAPVAATTRLR